MNLQKTVVDPRSAGIRLDLFNPLHGKCEERRGFSRSGIQKLIAEGQITLNGKLARASARLKTNDLVAIKTLPLKKSP
jgi:RNA-binding protein YlmH